MAKKGVMPVELHHSILSWWGRDALPWQKATPDVLPAVHLWFSPCSQCHRLPPQCLRERAGSDGCSRAGAPGRSRGICSSQTQRRLWPLPTWVLSEPHTTCQAASVTCWLIRTWASLDKVLRSWSLCRWAGTGVARSVRLNNSFLINLS